MLELNLTIAHMAGAVGLSYFLSIILKGYMLIRSIAWVFLWQLLTVTNDNAFVDILLCFSLFLFVEIVIFIINNKKL